MMRPEVRHIFRTERPTNFKLAAQMKYEDGRPVSPTGAITSKIKGQCRKVT